MVPIATVLDAAADRSADQPTVAMTMRLTMDGEQFSSMTSHGTSDGTTARVTVELPILGDLTMLVVDGTQYVSVPGLPDGKEWVRGSTDGAPLPGMDAALGGAQDPVQAFGALAAASDDAVEVGPDLPTVWRRRATGSARTSARCSTMPSP